MRAPLFSSWRLETRLVLLVAFFCVSCSSKVPLYPVHGKVLYKGEAIEGILVTFHPKGGSDMNTIFPGGETEEDGTFTVRTGGVEGAPVGEYVVTFMCPLEGGKKKNPAKGMTVGKRFTVVDRFQGAYARETTSHFRAEIKSGDNELEPFNLK